MRDFQAQQSPIELNGAFSSFRWPKSKPLVLLRSPLLPSAGKRLRNNVFVVLGFHLARARLPARASIDFSMLRVTKQKRESRLMIVQDDSALRPHAPSWTCCPQALYKDRCLFHHMHLEWMRSARGKNANLQITWYRESRLVVVNQDSLSNCLLQLQ